MSPPTFHLRPSPRPVMARDYSTLEPPRRDGPLNYRIPDTADHFRFLGLDVPDFVYSCQEQDGPLSNSIGSTTIPLLPNGGAEGWGLAVPGWNRKFVGTLNNAAGGGFRTSSAALDLLAGESYAMMMLASYTTPGAPRTLIGAQGANDRLAINGVGATGGIPRVLCGNIAADGTIDESGIDDPEFFVWFRNCATSEAGFYTPYDLAFTTFSGNARTGQIKSIGEVGVASALVFRCGWAAIFKGVNAERDFIDYMTKMMAQ